MRLFTSILLSICLWSVATADDSPIAVVHYKAPDQYRPIINSIINGIEDAVDVDVIRIVIEKDDQSSLAHLKALSPSIPIISITPAVQSVINQLGLKNRQILGATTKQTQLANTTVVTLAAPLEEYIEELRGIAVKSTRLHYIYHPDGARLAEITRVQNNHAITIVDHEVESASDVLLSLRRIFSEQLNRHDAIYLESDVVSHNPELITRYIVEQSWKHHIPVFTDSTTLVKKGFLFTIIPNYEEHGRRLGQLASDTTASHPLIRHTPSSALLINRRTLIHLGLPTPDARKDREVIYVGKP